MPRLLRFQVRLSPAPHARARELDRVLNRPPSNVPQIQQARIDRSQFAVAEGEIDATYVDAAFAYLKDKRLRAARLRLHHRLFHECMRVAAGDKVDAIDLRRDHRIASISL